MLSNHDKDKFIHNIINIKTPTLYSSSSRKKVTKDGDLRLSCDDARNLAFIHARAYVNMLQDVSYVLVLCLQKNMCKEFEPNITRRIHKGSGNLFSLVGKRSFPLHFSTS